MIVFDCVIVRIFQDWMQWCISNQWLPCGDILALVLIVVLELKRMSAVLLHRIRMFQRDIHGVGQVWIVASIEVSGHSFQYSLAAGSCGYAIRVSIKVNKGLRRIELQLVEVLGRPSQPWFDLNMRLQ